MISPNHDVVAEQDFEIHEHRELLPWIDRLHDVGLSVGHVSVGEVAFALHRVVTWFERDLEDHTAWEESWLYPEIDERVGTPWATRTMRYCHVQIRAAVRHLSAEGAAMGHELTAAQAGELRYRIFGLEAMLRAHLDMEERILLPALDESVARPAEPER